MGMLGRNETLKVLKKIYNHKPLTRDEAAEMVARGFATAENEMTENGLANLPMPRGERERPRRFFVKG